MQSFSDQLIVSYSESSYFGYLVPHASNSLPFLLLPALCASSSCPPVPVALTERRSDLDKAPVSVPLSHFPLSALVHCMLVFCLVGQSDLSNSFQPAQLIELFCHR